MKQLLASAIGIGFLILFLSTSCSDKSVRPAETNSIDSLKYYTQLIQQKEHPKKKIVLLADSGLSFSTKTTDSILFFHYKLKALDALKKHNATINSSKSYLNLVSKINSKPQMAYANAYLGYYYHKLHKKDSAYFYYNIANKQYAQLKDTVMQIICLQNISKIQVSFADYNGSEKTAINALTILKEKTSSSKHLLLNTLARISRNKHNYKEAIYWNNKALKATRTNSDSITTLQNKSLSYRDLKQYSKAITIFDSLLQHPIKNSYSKARIIDNLAYTKWLQNNHNSTVIPALKKAERMRTETKDWIGLNASYAHLSDVYLLINPVISHNYALKMLAIATQLNSPEDRLEALQKLLKTEVSSIELKKHYNNYIHISDSLKIIKQQQELHYSKLKYDTEKNRADNLKLTISNTHKDIILAKKKIQNIVGYTVLSLISISIIAIAVYRRKKLQQEKREEIYKTETRISKKLHDEVANDLVHIMNNVQYSNQNKEALLENLQKLYLLTRNISHQNSRIKAGKQFEEELKNMLDGFSSPKTKIILRNISSTALKSLKKDLQRDIFRILQELMVNMQKHSKASLVVVSFEKKGSQYTISYADNGQGTDLTKIKSNNGLSNMESRIKNIDGTITFESEVNKGFKSIIRFKK